MEDDTSGASDEVGGGDSEAALKMGGCAAKDKTSDGGKAGGDTGAGTSPKQGMVAKTTVSIPGTTSSCTSSRTSSGDGRDLGVKTDAVFGDDESIVIGCNGVGGS